MALPADDTTWSTQRWLERTAWRGLRDTSYGRPLTGEAEHPALRSDPLLRKVYLLDLALFIGAERASYHAVSGMVGFAPDERAQMQLGTQVFDECRHFEVFCHRMANLGVTPEQRNRMIEQFTTRSLRAFYDLIQEQVDRRDFLASCIAQNLVLEGMAYPMYRYEIKYWSRFDPGLKRTIQGAFADESHHVTFGEAICREALRRATVEQKSRIVRLLADCHRLMSQAFEEVITHYVGLYQECANQYMDEMGDIEIFPGIRLATVSEDDQARLLLQEIQGEHQDRLRRIGL
jgi:ribonucleotide reductase beta subunit family protein with ferritin-like domain